MGKLLELKPCPWCGCEEINNYVEGIVSEEVHTCFCMACDAVGPPALSQGNAEQGWNKRPKKKEPSK